MDSSAKISVAEWEQVISDFSAHPESQQKWQAAYPPPMLLDLALGALLRDRDAALKLQLAVFVEEHALLLLGEPAQQSLPRVLQALKASLSTPQEAAAMPPWLRQQMMVMATAVFIEADAMDCCPLQLQALIELLLSVASRPNSSLSERGLRSASCESLRAMETAWPCILAPCAGHFFSLLQSERSPAVQAYLLLLLTTLQNAATHLFFTSPPSAASASSPPLPPSSNSSPGSSPQVTSLLSPSPAKPRPPVRATATMASPLLQRRNSPGILPALLSTAQPLAPYTLPTFWASQGAAHGSLSSIPQQEVTPSVLREFRRAISALLEASLLATESGAAELLGGLARLSRRLGLGGAHLRHHPHCEALLHSSRPLLCHALLWMYSLLLDRNSDSFRGDLQPLVRRLAMLTQEPFQPLIFRHLAVHWLISTDADTRLADTPTSRRGSPLFPLAPLLYPDLFDPLSLKAAKIAALAQIVSEAPSIRVGATNTVREETERERERESEGWHDVAVEWAGQLLTDSLVCANGFKHQPSHSMEAALTFWTLHHFLMASARANVQNFHSLEAEKSEESHPPNQHPSKFPPPPLQTERSGVFELVKETLTLIAKEHAKLLSNLLSFLVRLLHCRQHSAVGEELLQALQERLLPSLRPSKELPLYFRLLEQLVKNSAIPPRAALQLLEDYIRWRGRRGGGRSRTSRLWLRGQQVLGICRTALLQHSTSRVFDQLQSLLGYMAKAYPELEVRDTSRRYIRLLSSCPGWQLRKLLQYDGEKAEPSIETSGIPRLTSLGDVSIKPPKSRGAAGEDVRASVWLRRVTPLLVQHSWELVVVPAVEESLWGREVGDVTTVYGSNEHSSGRGSGSESGVVDGSSSRTEGHSKGEMGGESEERGNGRVGLEGGEVLSTAANEEVKERKGVVTEQGAKGLGDGKIDSGETAEPTLGTQSPEMVALLRCYFTHLLQGEGKEKRKIKLQCALRYVDVRAGEAKRRRQESDSGGDESGKTSTGDFGEKGGEGDEKREREKEGAGRAKDMPKREPNQAKGEEQRERRLSGEGNDENGGAWVDGPVIYAAVVRFQNSNLYAPVGPVHVPFLVRESVEEAMQDMQGRGEVRKGGRAPLVAGLIEQRRESVEEQETEREDGRNGAEGKIAFRNEGFQSMKGETEMTHWDGGFVEDGLPRKRGRREQFDEGGGGRKVRESGQNKLLVDGDVRDHQGRESDQGESRGVKEVSTGGNERPSRDAKESVVSGERQETGNGGQREREADRREEEKGFGGAFKPPHLVVIELEPKQPAPALLMATVEFTDEEGSTVEGALDSIPVGIEDLFLQAPTVGLVSEKVSEVKSREKLFNALWEICSTSGESSFSEELKAAVLTTERREGNGTVLQHVELVLGGCAESVKLVDVAAERVVEAVEERLAAFVVAVEGGPLVHIIRKGGILKDVAWKESSADSRKGSLRKRQARNGEEGSSSSNSSSGKSAGESDLKLLRLEARESVSKTEGRERERGRREREFEGSGWKPRGRSETGVLLDRRGDSAILGTIHLLIFLPPKFHLLMRLEISDWSTTARMRTDYWPCLAHVDEYLEALTGFLAE